jgi:hypothetical protein
LIPKLPCSFSVCDALIDRRRITRGERQYQAHVGRLSGMHGAVKEQLPQNVMLRMTPAHALRFRNSGPHPIERGRILAAPVREHRF